MYWMPVISSAASQGAPSTASSQTSGVTTSTKNLVAQASTPSSSSGAPIACGMPAMMQLSMAASGSQPSDTHTLISFPSQQTPVAHAAEGAGMAASFVPAMINSNQQHFLSFPDAAAPFNSMTPSFAFATGSPVMAAPGAPVTLTASGAPIGSYPSAIYPSSTVGGLVNNMPAASIAACQAGSVSGTPQPPSLASVCNDTLRSYTSFPPSAQIVPQLYPGAVPCYSAPGCVTPAGSFLFQAPAVTSTTNLPPPPQYNSITNPRASGSRSFLYDFSGASVASKPAACSQSAPVVRNGDAGKGYEAGVYYEGRVKRFNPIRGYGFVSAMYKLIPLENPTVTRSTEEAMSLSTNERQVNTPIEKPLNISATTNADEEAESSSRISASDEPSVGVKDLEVVYIRGVPHTRHPVTMGDIFVHYHCLQRTSNEADTATNEGLVNLPVGSRVQFKAEVFVPAELMEKATDSKEAAEMLNKLGIPIEYNPNLLSGAIAATKGWGYQAIDVHLLPPQGPPPILPGEADRAGAAQNASSVNTPSKFLKPCFPSANETSLRNGADDGKEMSSDNNKISNTASRGVSSAHLRSQRPTIHIPVEKDDVTPPPSFEAATAGMGYVMAPPNATMYMTNYVLGHYI
ncbi:hypothetical protein JKF63_03862 [Porcisia hertigi]|uniref:Uncharacterized protein n=1 Tax=Porcisia hertigi TaxID=2761500 RepID=A0A836I3L6_9TRYP|nr:hypothetical protein JKF63_03862 [Porcisia hertigi]